MQNYNFTQKFLHDLVFKYTFINKSLFEIEKFFYLKKDNLGNNSHVFITGLPRSGTTILLNFIYSSGEFASLKYSNMPFIFSPNISKLFYRKNIGKKERLHGDGIYYDLDSPEAFDEIFLSQKESYIKDDNGEDRVMLNADDVTEDIRTNEISKLASEYASIEIVRGVLREMQKRLVRNKDYIAEGRDMGTYVFPNADFKFY